MLLLKETFGGRRWVPDEGANNLDMKALGYEICHCPSRRHACRLRLAADAGYGAYCGRPLGWPLKPGELI